MRDYTNKLLEMISEGILNPETMVQDLLGYMSEEDVKAFCRDNDIIDLEEDYYDESMDGDHASGLASPGWGTDEDYGHFGDDY
jgi:hypothetical protein